MRIFFFILLLLSPCFEASGLTKAETLVAAARDRTKADVHYDGRYVRIKYPDGDVPADMGVCSDVVIRAYRAAFGYDLQKYVHEDMKTHFHKYSNIWGMSHPDSNIDHRRVPNLEVFFARHGQSLPSTKDPAAYKPGDIVTWRIDGRLPHIGIVSDKTNAKGIPLIIHNIGAGPKEEDFLFLIPTYRHYRFIPRYSANE